MPLLKNDLIEQLYEHELWYNPTPMCILRAKMETVKPQVAA